MTANPNSNHRACYSCKGKGILPSHRVLHYPQSGRTVLEVAKECPNCDGTGLRLRTPLPSLNLLVDPAPAYEPAAR